MIFRIKTSAAAAIVEIREFRAGSQFSSGSWLTLNLPNYLVEAKAEYVCFARLAPFETPMRYSVVLQQHDLVNIKAGS